MEETVQLNVPEPSDVVESRFSSYATGRGWTLDGIRNTPGNSIAIEGVTLRTWRKRIEMRITQSDLAGSQVEIRVITDELFTQGALRRVARDIANSLIGESGIQASDRPSSDSDYMQRLRRVEARNRQLLRGSDDSD